MSANLNRGPPMPAYIPPSPLPPPPFPFLSLPVELQSRVVRMAKDQDDALRNRLEISRFRIRKRTQTITRMFKWYGRSAQALYGTCRALARPLIFETVHLSQTITLFFGTSILPRHAHLIKHLVFDDCDEPKEAVPTILINSAYMTSLSHLTFSCWSTTKEVIALEERLKEGKTSVILSCLKPALTALKTRIVKLTCTEMESVGFACIMRLWPHVESLAYDSAWMTTEGDDVDEDGALIESLSSLRHLEVGTSWAFNHFNLEVYAQNRFDYTISKSWAELKWEIPLQSLGLATQTFGVNDWIWLASFRNTLRELKLEVMRIEEGFNFLTLASELRYTFPLLETLTFLGGGAAAKELLTLLQGSPLKAISLEFIETDYISHNISFLSKAEGPLTPFSATLKSLTFSQFGCRTGYQSFQMDCYGHHFNVAPTSRRPPHDNFSFYHSHLPYLGRSVVSDDRRTYTILPRIRGDSAYSVLYRTAMLLNDASLRGDYDVVDKVNFAMETLTTFMMMGED